MITATLNLYGRVNLKNHSLKVSINPHNSIDDYIDEEELKSTNPVQNKVIAKAILELKQKIDEADSRPNVSDFVPNWDTISAAIPPHKYSESEMDFVITSQKTEPFAETSWSDIADHCRSGIAKWRLGETKPITLLDGKTYTARICDNVKGRYSTKDGIKNSYVLEFVEPVKIPFNYSSIPFSRRSMSTYGTDDQGFWRNPGVPNSLISIESLLPADFRAACLDVLVPHYRGRDYTKYIIRKAFAPGATEICPLSLIKEFDREHFKIEGKMFELYSENGSNNLDFFFTNRDADEYKDKSGNIFYAIRTQDGGIRNPVSFLTKETIGPDGKENNNFLGKNFYCPDSYGAEAEEDFTYYVIPFFAI